MTKYDIIGATGCTTGIAHTYMAKKALEEAAQKRGLTYKFEAHGRMGVENALTPEEIKDAGAVVVASDKDVDSQRFAGKPMVDVPVAHAIKDPDALITQALAAKPSSHSQQVDYGSGENVSDYISAPKSGKGLGFTLYRALMNGVSNMLPFVVGGGVLIALSLLWGINSADPKSDQYNQIAFYMHSVGTTAFSMMVPMLAGGIAKSISSPAFVGGLVGGLIATAGGTGFLGGIVAGFAAGYIFLGLTKALTVLPKNFNGIKAIFLLPVLGNLITGFLIYWIASPMKFVNEGMVSFLEGFQDSSPIVLGIIMGCMCAFDMGGPVNKAASLVALALLAKGNYFFIAGFSAACIAPPLITGIATTVFRKYYTVGEQNAGLVNYLLGSTHITEGAIPFVVEDPLRNMPIMMLGSSIAASMTYLFRVQVPAPAGAFLVLPIVVHPFLWLLAIFTGAIIGGLLLGYARKRKVLAGKKEIPGLSAAK